MDKGKEGRGAVASFTVEAALLMTLILPVLIALIVLGFYLHDRACLQGIAAQVCAMESNLALYENREHLVNETKAERLAHTMLQTRGACVQVSADGRRVHAAASGSFPLPGIAARLLGGELKMSASWKRTLLRPTELIWRIRAAKYTVDEIFS